MRSKSTRRPQFTCRPPRLIIGLLIISSAIVWVLVGRLPFTATAFKPVGEARATDFDKTHTQMTDEAIRELITGENIIPGVTKISKSMREAIKLIKRGNSNSDLQLYGMYLDDEAHFTGETFAGSQARIYSQFLLIKTALRANDLYNARKALGQTFHAIQDFYTHSNWIEKGNTGINPNVGDFSRTGALLASAALPFETTCDNCEIENCQDCVGNIITPSLTTAYFQALPLTGFKPLGKCSHGGTHWDLSQDFPATGGINKDTLDCEVSPHNYHHLQAAALAKEHTKEYLRFLRKNLRLGDFKKLLGVGNTLGLAIDTSGSMSEEIAGVKVGANAIVDARVDTSLEPGKYVLIEINDPYSIVDADTDDPDTFKNALNGLGAFAGGDCPELTFMALIDALGRFDETGGELMVFTDASAKDGGLAGAVIGLAQEKDVKISFMLSGSCSPIDREFYRISRETGGQSFVIDENQAQEATKLADFAVRPDSIDIAHVNGILSATPVTHTVPVDSTLTSVTFSISGGSAITITRPNGTPVLPTDPGVTSANISGGKVLSISNTTVGTWSVTLAGDGEFTMRVMGESDLVLSTFDVVEFRDFGGHDGYKPISGHALAGQPSKVSAEISAGTYNTANFELRLPGGAVIQSLSLPEVPNLEGASSRLYFGDVMLPNTPVLAYVTGTDLNGQPYQRVLPQVIKPQTVKVSAPASELIYPGHEKAFTVDVTNHGASGTFELNARDEDSFISYVSPSAFTLNTRETIQVTVHAKAPASVTSRTVDNLTVTVESTGSVETKNFALTELIVIPELTVGPESVLGGDPSIGTVSLFGGMAPSGGTVVTLESSNPTVASVPASITVPWGREYMSFVVSTTAVMALTPVTITASYGSVSLTTVLQVAPAADSLVSVQIKPSTFVGGKLSHATVGLNGPAPVGGVQVTLSSNAPSVSVPASVTVPEGSYSATVDLTTTAVTTSTPATITAVYNGITQTASLTLIPIALDSISVEPADLAGGIYTSAVVGLSGPAPTGGATITLESGNPSIVTVPAQVTVPAGQRFATFVGSVATTAPTFTTAVAVKAMYEGITASGYVRVTPSFVPSNLYLNPSKLAGGQTSTGTVELNSPAPPGGGLVTLSTSDSNLVTLPPNVTVPEGATSTTFSISTSSVTSMTSASVIAAASGVGRTELVTLLPTTLQSISLTPSSIGAGNTSTGQVTMSNPAPTGGALVSLSSDTAVATVQPTVTVAAGATTATFSVNTAPVELSSTSTISASYAGDTKTATLRVFGVNDVVGTIVANGPPVTITTTNSGQNARLLFDGTAGQRVSLKMSSVTISSSIVAILKTDGSNLTNNIFVGTGGAFLDTTTLPAAGTYTILIDPNGAAVGSMTLQLYDVPADVNGSISVDGTPVVVTTTSPGQNARLTFDGTAGQQITVRLTGNAIGGTTVTLYRPDGTTLTSLNSSSSAFNLAAQTIVTTGTYIVQVDPNGANIGNITLSLYDPVLANASNLAFNKPATQSSTNWGASAGRAVDGNTDGNFSNNSVTHTQVENQAWWQVDLESVQSIGTVRVWNRTDCCGDALTNFYVFVSDEPFTSTDLVTTQNQAGVSTYHVPGQGGTPTTINVNRSGRYVRVQLAGVERLSLAEVQVLLPSSDPTPTPTPTPTPNPNLALNKTATQSSTNWSAPAGRAVDGNTNGNFSNNSVTHTQVENQAWWQVDLESSQSIGTVKVWNRTDCCGDALTNFYVFVSDEPFTSTDLVTTQNQVGVSSYHVPGQGGTPTTINVNRSGRYVRVQLAGVERLSLAEVQVLSSSSDPDPNLALNKTATQSSTNWSAPASRAVDGNTNGNFSNNSVTHTQVENQAWWQVDLDSVQSIGNIKVWNRTDCCGDALTNFYVFVSDSPFTSTDLVTTQNQSGVSSYHVSGQGGTPSTINVNRSGRYVRVQLASVERLSLAEVEVFGP